MALQIGIFCGNGPELWLRMQAAHDRWHAARTVDVNALPTMTAA
jgi:plasmid maintenance system antidote protein VapI